MKAFGLRGMVASPHYLATAAGVAVLRRGGNAVDAAIATNSVLAVVAPEKCGIGGDLFAMVFTRRDGHLQGINGSGKAAHSATLERVQERTGSAHMPIRGPLSVTVPGCVDAWFQLHGRYGRLEMTDILQDAISYAANGFAATNQLARALTLSESFLHPSMPARATFWTDGAAPTEGTVIRQPALADSLRKIARGGAAEFYKGSIAREIAASLQAIGGLLDEEDLSTHESQWVKPIKAPYRGVDVFELPPNSQGLAALIALRLLDGIPRRRLAEGGDCAVHVMSEALRLAYADRDAYMTDVDHMRVAPAAFLEREYIEARASCMGERAAPDAVPGIPGDTAYMCAADENGNLVSLIQSNFMGVGSGVMAGSTGIMLQNRGAMFSLDPDHSNAIAPGKRTLHTLMPAMAFKAKQPWLVFGTMGGSAQAQIHVQILSHLLDQDRQIDDAIDLPRFEITADAAGKPLLVMESRFSPEVIDALRTRGYAVELAGPYDSRMGHAHAIEVWNQGVFAGAADPRTHGLALGM
ncbi:MAG TPA: gamma-glutamyltransferase [Chloroflexota bacterium]